MNNDLEQPTESEKIIRILEYSPWRNESSWEADKWTNWASDYKPAWGVK